MERFKIHFDFENGQTCLKLKQHLMSKGNFTESNYEEQKKEYMDRTH
jgi:hypothetical protein